MVSLAVGLIVGRCVVGGATGRGVAFTVGPPSSGAEGRTVVGGATGLGVAFTVGRAVMVGRAVVGGATGRGVAFTVGRAVMVGTRPCLRGPLRTAWLSVRRLGAASLGSQRTRVALWSAAQLVRGPPRPARGTGALWWRPCCDPVGYRCVQRPQVCGNGRARRAVAL